MFFPKPAVCDRYTLEKSHFERNNRGLELMTISLQMGDL